MKQFGIITPLVLPFRGGKAQASPSFGARLLREEPNKGEQGTEQ